MSKPIYNIDSYEQGLIHFFKIESGQEIITKVVTFSLSKESALIYHLVFGNLMPDGNIDVYSTSSEDNMPIILNSVIKTMEIFFDHYPDKYISFTGSTPSRTRLYRAAIAKFIQNTELSYQVYGFTSENNLEIFDKSKTYSAYLIHKI